MTLEYTIEMGWDQWTHAGYMPGAYASPEEALAARGSNFHPDFDSVVRREVGTEKWSYHNEDQRFNRKQKLAEYQAAREKS